MKKIRNIVALAGVIIALSIINVSANTGHKPVKTIEQKVRSSILSLPYYQIFDNIGFSVNGGTVTLTGKVRNAVNRSEAEASVKHIAGVSSVINNIEILPPSGFDDSIRRDLYRALSNSGGLSMYLSEVNPDVRLIVENGHVTLEGRVATTGDYNAMNIVANTVHGVFSVQNHLEVNTER